MATTSENFTKDYGHSAAARIASMVAQGSGGQIPAPENSDELAHEMRDDVNAIWLEIQEKGGVEPATLLNLNPYPLHTGDPHQEGVIIAACPIGQMYHRHVFRAWARDLADRTDGGKKVRAVYPIQMAKDWERTHEGWGGIVTYRGDHLPGEMRKTPTHHIMGKLTKMLKDAREAIVRSTIEDVMKEVADVPQTQDKDIVEMLAKATELMVYNLERLFEEAERLWSGDRKQGYMMIGVKHKQAARWLKAAGRVATLPTWVTEKKQLDFVQRNCPKCGSDLADKAYACKECGRIDKPILAFKDHIIKKDDPALKRCTREELDAAGLHKVTTHDEDAAAEAAEEEATEKASPKGKGKDKTETK